MSSETGMLLTCDRCGGQVFLKVIGEHVADGGYTRRDKYEDAPGWKYYSDVRAKTLCPECSEQYKDLIASFMKEVEYEPLVRCPGAEGEELPFEDHIERYKFCPFCPAILDEEVETDE